MTDDVFLSAILAEPDDDLPRLAYADWLEERGDPRGEFIHVQCTLARMGEDGPSYSRLRERERELLDLHRPAWLGGLRPLAKQSTFRRGFLDEVALEPRAFLPPALPPCPPTVRRVLVSLEGYQADRQLVEHMPESVAYENLCFLFAERNRALFVATEERPEDPDLVEKLSFILNRDIVPVPATVVQIVDALVRHYGATVTESVDSILVDFEFVGPVAPLPPRDPGPDPMLVTSILRRAVRSGATQIRLEPAGHEVEVYLRVSGQLVRLDTIPRRVAPTVVTDIRRRCGLPADDGADQRGSFEVRQTDNLLSRFDVRITPAPRGHQVILDVNTNYAPPAFPS